MIRISDLSLRSREQASRTLLEIKKSASSRFWIIVTYLFARTARSMSHGSSCSVLIRSYMIACHDSSSPVIRSKNCDWSILSDWFLVLGSWFLVSICVIGWMC